MKRSKKKHQGSQGKEATALKAIRETLAKLPPDEATRVSSFIKEGLDKGLPLDEVLRPLPKEDLDRLTASMQEEAAALREEEKAIRAQGNLAHAKKALLSVAKAYRAKNAPSPEWEAAYEEAVAHLENGMVADLSLIHI